MEEVVVSGLCTVVFEKLSSPILKEFGLLWGVNNELEKIRTTLLTINSVLRDTEEKQGGNGGVRVWLRKLKDAAYVADDVLDEFVTVARRRKVAVEDPSGNKVRKFTSLLNSLVVCVKSWYKIKKIRVKFDAIAKEGFDYGLEIEVADRRVVRQSEETHSFVIESEVYGREEEKEKIVRLLIATDNQQHLSIIPIVGMGGIGKTTLAQLAYNDCRVRMHFGERRWVLVSQQFDSVSIVQQLLMDNGLHETESPGILHYLLRQNLVGKRLLLVLDDVWCADYWESKRLKNMLTSSAGVAQGSTILLTTRSERVASIWGAIEPYYCLKGLSEDDCWTVFAQRAFREGTEENPNLIGIGRELVKKCAGLPLAAKTLGSLMRFKRDEREWLSMLHSDIWKKQTGMLNALVLCYNDLDSCLKQCFAYCSIFHNSCMFKKDDLIQQWMAEEFIQTCEASQQMEDIGTEYFNKLVSRSFFQVIEKDDEGNVISCKMHDLISALAQFAARDEYFYVEANRVEDIPFGTRHLTLELGETSPIPESLYKPINLRTLIIRGSIENMKEVFENGLKRLRCLCVLDLSGTGIKNLPSSISKLNRLRYLNLSHTNIRVLPKSIIRLINLQTLNLSCCSHLIKLPKDLSMMVNLRNLYINECDLLTRMPANISRVTSLYTLSMFIVSEEIGCSIGELKSLNLRGDLNIKMVKNVRNAIDAEEANLKEKDCLAKLRLSWGSQIAAYQRHFNYKTLESLYKEAVEVKMSDESEVERAEQVFEAIQPHPNLKGLEIWNYIGSKFPSWIKDWWLPNLISLELIKCDNVVDLPPLGDLPLLRKLHISGMDKVKKVRHGHFYSLECLTIEKMPSWEEWEVGAQEQEMVRLHQLILRDCPRLMTLPTLPISLRILEISNCTVLSQLPHRLPELEDLVLKGKDGVFRHFLPDLPRLRSLKIMLSPELTSVSLVLGQLNSLETLTINFCPKLHSLSELAKELQHMPSLRELRIAGCPLLTELFQMDEGEDRRWIVQHISHIEIDNRRIQ